MNRPLAATLIVALLVLGGLVVAQTIATRKMRHELDEIRDRIGRADSQGPTRAALDQVQEQVARVEKQVAALPPPAPPTPPTPAGKPGALPTLITEEDIRQIVDERLAQAQAEKKDAQPGGERKMPLHDIAKELALDPQTQNKMAEVANLSKKEIMDLLKTPRPDGSNVADEIVDAFLAGAPPKAQQVFLKIFTEKIPGTEVTYLAGVQKLQEKAQDGLRRILTPELYERFQHMNVKPNDIETGYDPFGEYAAQRAQK